MKMISYEVATESGSVLHNMEAKRGCRLPPTIHTYCISRLSSTPAPIVGFLHYTVRFIYVFSFRDFKAHSLLMTKRDLQEGHSGNISMEKRMKILNENNGEISLQKQSCYFS